jgi:hypothetical protein
MLLRFLYRHSPLLSGYPIIFDAVEQGINVEGGDMMIVSPTKMLLGVGNRTDPRIAPILARALDMEVVTVQTVKREFLPTDTPGDWGRNAELRILLLHLDTYFTHVAPRHGLATPYLLESAHAEDNPLSRFIRGAVTFAQVATATGSNHVFPYVLPAARTRHHMIDTVCHLAAVTTCVVVSGKHCATRHCGMSVVGHFDHIAQPNDSRR